MKSYTPVLWCLVAAALVPALPLQADHTAPFHKGYRGGCISGPHFGHHRPYTGAVSGHVGLHYDPYYSSHGYAYGSTHAYSYDAGSWSAHGGYCGPRYYSRPVYRRSVRGRTTYFGSQGSAYYGSSYYDSYYGAYSSSYSASTYGGALDGVYFIDGYPRAFAVWNETGKSGLPWRVEIELRRRAAAAAAEASEEKPDEASGSESGAATAEASVRDRLLADIGARRETPVAAAATSEKQESSPRTERRGYLYYPDTGEVVGSSARVLRQGPAAPGSIPDGGATAARGEARSALGGPEGSGVRRGDRPGAGR